MKLVKFVIHRDNSDKDMTWEARVYGSLVIVVYAEAFQAWKVEQLIYWVIDWAGDNWILIMLGQYRFILDLLLLFSILDNHALVIGSGSARFYFSYNILVIACLAFSLVLSSFFNICFISFYACTKFILVLIIIILGFIWLIILSLAGRLIMSLLHSLVIFFKSGLCGSTKKRGRHR